MKFLVVFIVFAGDSVLDSKVVGFKDKATCEEQVAEAKKEKPPEGIAFWFSKCIPIDRKERDT